jgi:hypothetical protein
MHWQVKPNIWSIGHSTVTAGRRANKRAMACDAEGSFDGPASLWIGESEDARQIHRGFWSAQRLI